MAANTHSTACVLAYLYPHVLFVMPGLNNARGPQRVLCVARCPLSKCIIEKQCSSVDKGYMNGYTSLPNVVENGAEGVLSSDRRAAGRWGECWSRTLSSP